MSSGGVGRLPPRDRTRTASPGVLGRREHLADPIRRQPSAEQVDLDDSERRCRPGAHRGPASARSTRAAGTADPFGQHGFWRMSPGGRSLVHADGTPALLVADTAWALPWRATADQVRSYARDRQAKGFNAVLLMTVQPDMRATGPRDRTADEGFDVGFEDLPAGHLTELHARRTSSTSTG